MSLGVADVSGARNPDYLIVELTLWCVTVSRAAGNRTSGEQCPLGLFRAARELLQTPFRRRQNSPFACKPSLCGSGHRAERRSEEHTSELQSHSDLVCRLLLEKKK